METFAKRYLVIADPDTRGSYFVYDRLLRRVVTGLVERSEATSLAAHMEQAYRRARQQMEAEEADEIVPPRMDAWSLGDWQWATNRWVQ